MTGRRLVLAGLGAAVLAAAGGYGLRVRAAGQYDAAAAAARAPLNLAATGAGRLSELVRMASLAPNSHNTQAWRFAALPGGLRLTVDPARRTPVVDPDDHHLFVSLGCALECLVQAATAFGIIATPDVAADGTVTLAFADGAAPSPLWPALTRRQSHRGLYDGVALDDADRAALMAADPGVRLIEDAATRAAWRQLTLTAYGAQMRDAAYRTELQSWLRFSPGAAMQTRDGLFSGCSGSPSLPQALGEALFPVLVTADAQIAALAAQIDSAPALALLVTDPDTPAGRIDTGRRLTRLGLAATLRGLALAHINPGLEDAVTRGAAARLIAPAPGRPSILLRLGRTTLPMPQALRRPPSQILLS